MKNNWRKVKLSEICFYAKEKIDITSLNKENYISTENMLPNKNGITFATTLPNLNTTQSFNINDVLVSNIRTYFKKIWFAKFNGGASNDVLIFRAKNNVDSKFLYYVLSDDKFFEYCMSTSKGTKMPRGDKNSIMNYIVPKFDFETQEKIAKVLSAFDDKIELNNKINENLEQQIKIIFINMFGEQISNLNNKKTKMLSEVVDVIDNRGKTPPLSIDKTPYPIVDVRALSGNTRIINYNNCTKYVSEETYNNWFRNGHPKQYDILLSTVGSLAEMKLFMNNIGCIAQNVVGYRCKISPVYLYQYLNYIKQDLLAYDIGSVQPSIKITHIAKHPIFVPNDEDLTKFHNISIALTKKIYLNSEENNKLIKLRDTLLPKLMNCEIDVEKIRI